MRKALIRIKTEEELGGRPDDWADNGAMDYLFGQTVEAGIDEDGDAFVYTSKRLTLCHWAVFNGQFEILEELGEIDSVRDLMPLDAVDPENFPEEFLGEVTLRVKTEEELGGRPEAWNKQGGMDYLFGRTVHGIEVMEGRYLILNHNMAARRQHGKECWLLRSEHVEVIDG